MALAFLLTVYLGFAALLQGGLNRKIGAAWGYPGTTLLNSIVLLVASGLVYLWVRFRNPDGLLQDRGSFQGFQLWYLAPGIFGFTIVLLIPFVIERIGALNLFVALIGSQLVASAAWDYFVEGIGISPTRIFGALLAFAGAVLATGALSQQK